MAIVRSIDNITFHIGKYERYRSLTGEWEWPCGCRAHRDKKRGHYVWDMCQGHFAQD